MPRAGSRSRRSRPGTPAGIKLLSLSPDASKVAVYGTDGSLSLWSLAEGKRIASKEGLAACAP